MMNWAKQQLANVAGIQEPIYGPSAIKSVAKQAESHPYTELRREDLRWEAMQSTCVETQTFYLMADDGHVGMAQVIYSNVAGIRTTCQFNSKIFYPRQKEAEAEKNDDNNNNYRPLLWCTDTLENHGFDEEGVSFFADNVAVTLSDDGTHYTIKSAVNEKSIVNLKVTRTAPGFQVGKDGTSYYGTDPTQPWGRMRHAFWPRCEVEGAIITEKEGEVDFRGRAFFVHALQGMKPHHAAAKWNFVNFQSPTYSAVMMEYVTPPSYGSTMVNVGGVAKDGDIITAGAANSAIHTAVREDPENDWPEPEAVKFTWTGKTKDGKGVEASIEGPLGKRLDRVDVMAEVPMFIKKIAGGVVGTKPYIYQYAVPMTLKLKIGEEDDDEVVFEQGTLFFEATFIS